MARTLLVVMKVGAALRMTNLHLLPPEMSGSGQQRRFRDDRGLSGYPSIAVARVQRSEPRGGSRVAVAAMSADRWLTSRLQNREYEPSFTLVPVEVGGVPNAIKFILHAPANMPPA